MLSRQRVEQIFRLFSKQTILVVGDVMLDEYLWGQVHRISPEAPVPIVRVVDKTYNLGGASNVARNITSLGATVKLVGVIGDDQQGMQLKATMENAGIDPVGLVKDRHRMTTLKTRVMAYNQQVVRIDHELDTPLDAETSGKLIDVLEHEIPRCQALIVSDYSKGVITAEIMDRIRAITARHNVVCAVDPKVKNFHLYHEVTVITPNHHEASLALGMEITGIESIQKAGFSLLERTNCQMILITWGKNGMGLFERDQTFHHIETVSKRVFDVTGAGDTVIAVFTLGLSAGVPPFESAYLANKAAGIVVSNVGTASVSPEELLATTL